MMTVSPTARDAFDVELLDRPNAPAEKKAAVSEQEKSAVP